MSKQIAGDILKKISEIKKNKSNNEKNSITNKDPFMGFDISKKGLNSYIKEDGSSSNLEELKKNNVFNKTDISSNKLDIKKELKEFQNENSNLQNKKSDNNFPKNMVNTVNSKYYLLY